jgi:RNA polymerase sigma-70 factor (ECF subfamily)
VRTRRAALILRDVLGFRAREAARILEVTEESVTSALKRARATLERHQRSREPAPRPGSAAEQRLVDELTRAFESADVDGIVALLAEDVWLTMPPLPLEYQGRALAAAFLRATASGPAGRPGCSRPGPTASPRSVSTSATRRRAATTRWG